MSSVKVGYRMRMYASDDTTILVSGIHGYPFLLSTLPNISDGHGTYFGYLEVPTGRRGRTDILSKRTDTGEITVHWDDIRITPGTGSNLARFITEFLGDTSGEEQLKGLLAVVEETQDGGVTWPTWFTGRLHQISQLDQVTFELVFRDSSEELDGIDIFIGRPHSSISYLVREQLHPSGLTGVYGPFAKAPTLSAISQTTSAGANLTLTAAAQHDPSNIMTDRFNSQLGWISNQPGNNFALPAGVAGSLPLRVHLTHTSGAYNGQSDDYGLFSFRASDTQGGGHQSVTIVSIYALPGGLPVPANGVTCEIYWYLNSPAVKDAPIYLDSVDPLTLWKNILEGKFSRLDAGGNPLRSVPVNGASFAALAGAFGTVRFIISDTSDAHTWIEENILQPLGLGYTINENNEIVALDLRLPKALSGLPTLTDSDVYQDSIPKWSTSRDTAYAWYDCTYYVEQQSPIVNLSNATEMFPVIAPGRITETELLFAVDNITNRRFALQTQDFQGRGLRAVGGEVYNNQDRKTWIEAQIKGMLQDLAVRFGYGAKEVDCVVRNASAATLKTGDWVLVTFSVLPDPATNLRGAQRLMQVQEKSPDPLATTLKLLDAGLSTTAVVPAIGTLAQETGNTRHGINVPITLNGLSEPVRVEIAITSTGTGSAPSATDPSWRFAGSVTAAGTLVVESLPAGMRVWPRARTEVTSGFQQPSAWVFPATAHIDTDPIPAPTGLGTSVSGIRSLFTWANGDSTLPVQIYLCTPSGGTPLFVRQLPAGSTQFMLENLAASSTYKVQAGHPDQFGGPINLASTTFSTATGGLTAPDGVGISLLIGIA